MRNKLTPVNEHTVVEKSRTPKTLMCRAFLDLRLKKKKMYLGMCDVLVDLKGFVHLSFNLL